ncbi:hypothetical protein SAMN05421753_11571 [Planctomicrobium piriforme]|uniref:Uncharacterized protein n=1 Tax=Planctomicrobium piriforme TaxID=1576369 RepID=A0A1I3NDL1_9PLAN|nr:hypothetical protein SAMN05421753_11571 [Planctomicrobium piriforme]
MALTLVFAFKDIGHCMQIATDPIQGNGLRMVGSGVIAG